MVLWQVLHGPFAAVHRTDSHITFFILLSVKGTTGFEAQIDKCLELAEYLYNKIKNREGYEMVFDGKVCIATSSSQLVNSTCLSDTAGSSVSCNKTCCCANISLPHGIQAEGG